MIFGAESDHSPWTRLSACLCAAALLIASIPVGAEPPATAVGAPPPGAVAPASAGAPASAASTANPAGPGAPAPATGTKDPLIEVSVDSLEISERNAKELGLIWNDSLIFEERSIPSIFNAGTMDRMTKLRAELKALITNNQARVLANPTLITKSSFEATFAVGGEIPYPTVGQGGVQGVEYKKYGVILKILPIITPRKTVEAQINVTVSNPDASQSILLNNIRVPAIASRDAGSKVEVLDGETVVLAGIKQSRRDKQVRKVPVLGSIPILGWLFRYTNEDVTQTSLVIFVTFRLLKS